MKSTQNKKIQQVKETTMVVGIDVGSEKHYFRAFNWRGIELTKKPVSFSNSMMGFNAFHEEVTRLKEQNGLEEILVGFEPTGHYWFNLGQFLSGKNIRFVMVNPLHVHRTKELDDNSPSKNDRKDPRVIANLVRDGRYFYTYMPTGVYAELRNASNRRFVLTEELIRSKNRLQKWIAVYFPEYKGIYTHIDSKGGLMVLKTAPTPEEIIKLGVDGIIQIWKDAKLRGNGHKKAMLIVNAASQSIGLTEGLEEARMEIQDFIEDYELQLKRLRYLLVQAAVSVIGKNEEFRQIHEYYTTRVNNPLKKMQSLIAVACKLIRVFHVILTKGKSYDASKMLEDIKRPVTTKLKVA